MKKGLSTTAILVILAVVVIAWGIKAYNNLVAGEETVSTAWAQVENVYQRRADLIPNLVATVKGYAQHEQNTFEAVTEARANATGMHVDASNLTPEQISQFQNAQGQLSTALGRLLAISENYPELKANENFKDLQAQLEGTENRISTERMKFNEAAKKFNVSVRRFPANIIAGIFGFQTKGYFEAAEGASTAPKVEF